MSMYETVDFYRTVLEMMGYTIRNNRVYLISEDGEEEAEVNGLALVLPDDTFLRNPKWDSEIPFHPLCENPSRGESEMVKMILQSVVANLNVSLLGVAIHLYKDVASMEDTKSLTTEQSELLSYVTNINPKVRKAIVNLVNTVTMEEQNSSLISTNLRRRCPLNGEKFERVCVVRFPLSEMDRKDKPYGLSSTAEVDTMRGLLDFIVPGWENDDTYSVGTNTFVAPYFTAVMMMYSKIGSRINEVIELYKDISPSLVSFAAPGAEKVHELITRPGHMERLRDAIPPLEGNKGSVDTSRCAASGYKIDQPKPAVDLPWEDSAPAGTRQVDQVVNQAQPPREDTSGEGVAYVPGKVVPQQQPTLGLSSLGGGMNYDPNSFHGRQMAKQALLQPLNSQTAAVGTIGASPFLESNEQSTNDGAYRPGMLRQAQQRQAQQAQQQQHTRPIGSTTLGF